MQTVDIIKKNLEAYEKLTGATTYQLAKKSGLSQSVFTRLKQNQVPGIDSLEKIASAMGITLSQLLDDGSGNGIENSRMIMVDFASKVQNLIDSYGSKRELIPSDFKEYINMAEASEKDIEAKRDQHKAKRLEDIEQLKNRKLPNQFTHHKIEAKKTREQLITDIVTGLPALDYDELNAISSSIEGFISDRPSSSKTTLAD